MGLAKSLPSCVTTIVICATEVDDQSARPVIKKEAGHEALIVLKKEDGHKALPPTRSNRS